MEWRLSGAPYCPLSSRMSLCVRPKTTEAAPGKRVSCRKLHSESLAHDDHFQGARHGPWPVPDQSSVHLMRNITMRECEVI